MNWCGLSRMARARPELRAGAGGVARLHPHRLSPTCRVSYFHAGGIDPPLAIRKDGVATVIPHQNWRGQFARGTYPSGAVSDCTGQTTACTAIDWPGYRTTAWHARSGDGPDIRTWFGGLVDDMRDASGQMYRRNRYYDPATGQFTQVDPIGLAGGLNAYGFAEGDPVTYNDPYGLCAFGIGPDAAYGHCGETLGAGEGVGVQQPGGPRRPRRGSGPSFGTGRSALPGGSLAWSEGRGRGRSRAHTLVKHVNVTRDDIVASARQEGRTHSRFHSLAAAENAIGLAINNNQVTISQWLAPGNYSEMRAIRFRAPNNIGEIAFPDGTVTPGRTVVVVLRRDRYNLNYWIHTSYVDP
jgi:RHS repeat-associated protein